MEHDLTFLTYRRCTVEGYIHTYIPMEPGSIYKEVSSASVRESAGPFGIAISALSVHLENFSALQVYYIDVEPLSLSNPIEFCSTMILRIKFRRIKKRKNERKIIKKKK